MTGFVLQGHICIFILVNITVSHLIFPRLETSRCSVTYFNLSVQLNIH